MMQAFKTIPIKKGSCTTDADILPVSDFFYTPHNETLQPMYFFLVDFFHNICRYRLLGVCRIYSGIPDVQDSD